MKYFAMIYRREEAEQRTCLTGNDRHELIKRAVATKKAWEHNGRFGPYYVRFGVFTDQIVIPPPEQEWVELPL